MKFPNRAPSRRPHGRILEIESGQVVCRRRGVVDIEACWTCPAYRGLSSGRVEGVMCGADGLTLPRAVDSLLWPFSN